jgi:hypothetical protein
LGRTRAVHAADKYARFAGDRWSSITRDARSDETRRVASAAQREPGGPVWQDPQLPRLPLVLREPKPGDLAPASRRRRCAADGCVSPAFATGGDTHRVRSAPLDSLRESTLGPSSIQRLSLLRRKRRRRG